MTLAFLEFYNCEKLISASGQMAMTARTFKNADEAASELLRKGFKRLDPDPDYPFEIEIGRAHV